MDMTANFYENEKVTNQQLAKQEEIETANKKKQT